MRTEYLDELYPYELKKELSNLGVELTDEQYRILSNRGRTYLYASRTRHKDKKASDGLFRLTIIFYFIWTVFLSFVIQPIKWLITGNVYFSTESWVYKFTIKWMRKVGL